MARTFLLGLCMFLTSVPACRAEPSAASYVSAAAKTLGIPVDFALKIARIESGTQCGAKNRHSGAAGPMQILPSTARKLGYRNIRGASCATQAHAGVKYLAYCMQVSGRSRYRAARCYNGGPAAMHSRSRAVHRYAMEASR